MSTAHERTWEGGRKGEREGGEDGRKGGREGGRMGVRVCLQDGHPSLPTYLAVGVSKEVADGANELGN